MEVLVTFLAWGGLTAANASAEPTPIASKCILSWYNDNTNYNPGNYKELKKQRGILKEKDPLKVERTLRSREEETGPGHSEARKVSRQRFSGGDEGSLWNSALCPHVQPLLCLAP